MANFKLNSVLVATESGGTVTLDSGTVIPAAGVTGTLPNAVQDNITRLGTVTVGNLSNTAIGYPSGHVLQTGYIIGPSSATTTTSTSWVEIDSQEVSLTAIQTNGKYSLQLFSGRIDANNTSNIMAVTCYKNENGGGYSQVSGTSYGGDIGFGKFDAGAYEGYGGYHGPIYTASITAGQNIKFKPYYRKHSGSGTVVYMNNEVRWYFLVQEIQL